MDPFYDQLQGELSRVPSSDVICVMGDLNAKVGESNLGDNSSVMGMFGFGRQNQKRNRQVDVCSVNDLFITNTYFRQSKTNQSWAWESPDKKTHNQIDYILVSRRMKGSVQNIRSFPSADVGSEHQLVLANLKLKLKRYPKQRGSLRTNTDKLGDDKILKDYKLRMDERWDSIHDQNKRSVDKQAFQVTEEEVLGCKKRGEKAAWLSSETCHIAEQRREAKQRRKEGEAAAKHLNYLC